MLNSFKMTAGKRTFRTALIYLAVPTALNIVFGVILKLISNEHLRDFVDGFISSSAGICLEVAVMVSICIVYNSNNAAMPGYRFFHSVSGSAERFKKGLIFANLLGIIAAALYTVSGLLFLPHKEFIILVAVAVLFALGWVNIFGSRGKIFLSLIPLFALGMIFGFLAGSAEDEEPFILLTTVPMIIVSAVMAVFYIVSAVYVITNAKKIWEKEM